MQTRNVLLAALLAALSGCQSEVSVPKPADQAAVPAPAPISVNVKVTMAGQEAAPQVQQETAVAAPSKAPASEAVKPPPAASALPPVAPSKPAAATRSVETTKPADTAKPGGVLSEADALALAKKGNCLACHAIAKKMVGPAWRDVAVKYRNDAGAENRLVDKVAKGGSGVWGAMAMPPSPQVSEADRRKLVRFILSLK
ncbi:MAG TPA: c-type cytochrome [Gallionella sp.]